MNESLTLAEIASPSSLELGGWLVCLAAVAFGANEVMKMIDRFAGKRHEIAPQPLVVQSAMEYATKEELRQLRESIAEHRRDSDEGRRKIYDKMESIRLEVKEDIEGVHERINAISEEMPSRVVALLKNTGAIK
jgi:hypothetical protein